MAGYSPYGGLTGVVQGLPWFIWDLDHYQLITSRTIPEGQIKDVKSIVLAETPIPGRNSQPVAFGGNGNRKISFTLPIVRRNNLYGDVLILKQFDALRNQSGGFLNRKKKGQFSPNPKVLYYWGTGSIPLVWYVSKCDFSHESNMVSGFGMPQMTYIDMELILDETHPLYKAEEQFRTYAGLLGNAENLLDVTGVKFQI
jgi:hypothetical protein